MCIVCECEDTGIKFLNAFDNSRIAMKKAAKLMLECSHMMNNVPGVSNQYDVSHKLMIKLIRDWNRIEQTREVWDYNNSTLPSYSYDKSVANPLEELK